MAERDSEEFVFKPNSEKDDNAVVLLPSSINSNEITVTTEDGRRVTSTIDRRSNGNRPTFRFDTQGSDFGSSFTIDDGTGNTFRINNGDQRTSTTDLDALREGRAPNSQRKSGSRGGGQGGIGSSQVFTSPGGNQASLPGFVDFNSIAPAFVDFNSALQFGQNLGAENRETFVNNLTDPAFADAALGFVNTDVTGIINAGNRLGQFNREQGNIDTRVNQQRAGSIDQFNLARIPGFNEFNQEQVSQTNEFARAEREKSIQASGIDFRGRANTLLEQLETQATGRLSDGVLDDLLSDNNKDLGADIASARGFGGRSSAAGNVKKNLDLNQRLSILQSAQAQLPGVLGSFQQILQPPEQQAPTIFGQPTAVPLNTSNVADRLPVTSNISAGAAQQQAAVQATDIETIDAELGFQSNLQTQQFNESSRVDTAFRAGELTQQQFLAEADATQGLINADKGDQIRNQQFQQYQQGLALRQENETAAARAQASGFAGASAASNPNIGSGGGQAQSSGIAQTIATGATAAQILDSSADGIGAIINTAGGAYDAIFGDGDGKLTIGNTDITGEAYTDFINDITDFHTSGSTSETPSQINGQQVVGSAQTESGEAGYELADGTVVPQSDADPSLFRQLTQPIEDLGVDQQTLLNSIGTLVNWDNMSGSQRTTAVSDIGISVLENKGLLSKEEVGDVKVAANAISVLADDNASGRDKAIAVTQALAAHGTTSFTGSADAPTQIGGIDVVGSATTADGNQGFELADGTIVDKSVVQNTSNAMNGLQALSVLTSDAPTAQKASALAKLGIRGAAANDIITQAQAGNSFAALSVLDTAMNWDKMTPIQKAASIAKTGSSVITTFSGTSGSSATSVAANATSSNLAATGTSSAASAGGSSTASNIATGLGLVASAAGIVMGVDQAASTIDAVDDMPQSQAVSAGTVGLASSGAAIGAGVAGAAIATGAVTGSVVPVVGTVIGALLGATVGIIAGSTGTGKGSGQIMRDAWRGGLEEAGFAEKIDGSHHVPLADGSTYDIGVDGTNKLQNKGQNLDGSTERNTFDVDWSDPNSVESIPAGHLYAIATGLSPSNNDFDLFDRVVGQSLNAATSNAATVNDVNQNFRAMMQKADPRHIGLRIEMLRQGNEISDEEYTTYLGTMNTVFGSQITPIDREEGRQGLITMLNNRGELTDSDKDFLELIQSDTRLSENRRNLIRRLEGRKNA